MKRILVLAVAMGLMFFATSEVRAQNLLTNGNLDDPGTHEDDTATGWTLTEFLTLSGPENTATMASFANHTPFTDDDTQVGLWYRGFVGNADNGNLAQADLTQSVAGTPGTIYALSAWSRFETNWPDDVGTILAIDWLAGDSSVIDSVELELRDAGQTTDGEWRQSTVMGVAPAGTVSVQARASMVDGHIAEANPQSAFMDDFELTIIPEPTSFALFGLALIGLIGVRRRSN